MHEGDPEILRVARRAQVDRAALPENRAAVGREHPADDIHQGGFAGAVFAGERMHLGGANVEIDAFEHPEAAEGLGDAAQLQQAQAAPRRGRLPHHQRALFDDASRVAAGEQFEQNLGGLAAHLMLRLPDGGQRRVGVGGEEEVVEAGDRDVAGTRRPRSRAARMAPNACMSL